MYYPSKKPIGLRKTQADSGKKIRILTYRGVTCYGIPQFPTDRYEDYAWVPKPLLSQYFEDGYFEEAVWAATHSFY